VIMIVPTILGAAFDISMCGPSIFTSNAYLIMEEDFSRSREKIVLKVYPLKT
jgi:hypothetical protein